MSITRNEILAMVPGRELDALVAEKVMGWTVFRETWNHYELIEDEYAQGFPPSEEVEGVPFEIEEYSTKISDAWKVLGELYQGRVYLRIDIRRTYNEVVAFAEDRTCICVATARTVPVAICRAALLVRLVEEVSI